MYNYKTVDKLDIVRLNVQLTKKCNQKCKSCNSYLLHTEDEMSTDRIIETIKQICDIYNIKNIAFTGGEPTLHKDILKIVNISKKYSPNVSITTNGYYFNDRNKVKELIDAGVNRFSFSYHGIGKHDEFTGVPGSELRIRKAIGWVCEERKNNSNLYIKIGTLFNGSNIDTVESMLEYAENMGIDLYIELLDEHLPIFSESKLKGKIILNKNQVEKALNIISSWKKSGRSILLDDAGFNFMKLYFMDRSKITGNCPLGKTDIYIESNGNVRTGCWVLPPVGNVSETSIENIINSERYKDNINKMLCRHCSGCTCGYLMQGKYLDCSHKI